MTTLICTNRYNAEFFWVFLKKKIGDFDQKYLTFMV